MKSHIFLMLLSLTFLPPAFANKDLQVKFEGNYGDVRGVDNVSGGNEDDFGGDPFGQPQRGFSTDDSHFRSTEQIDTDFKTGFQYGQNPDLKLEGAYDYTPPGPSIMDELETPKQNGNPGPSTLPPPGSDRDWESAEQTFRSRTSNNWQVLENYNYQDAAANAPKVAPEKPAPGTAAGTVAPVAAAGGAGIAVGHLGANAGQDSMTGPPKSVGQEANVNQGSVPFLSKIPLIGGLFRGGASDAKPETVITVTPRIVHQTEE